MGSMALRVLAPVSSRAVWTVLALMLVALLGLFSIGLDQGQMLAPLLGNASYTLNIVHEVAHDARHAAGLPCH